jgi:hypothetical protein
MQLQFRTFLASAVHGGQSSASSSDPYTSLKIAPTHHGRRTMPIKGKDQLGDIGIEGRNTRNKLRMKITKHVESRKIMNTVDIRTLISIVLRHEFQLG